MPNTAESQLMSFQISKPRVIYYPTQVFSHSDLSNLVSFHPPSPPDPPLPTHTHSLSCHTNSQVSPHAVLWLLTRSKWLPHGPWQMVLLYGEGFLCHEYPVVQALTIQLSELCPNVTWFRGVFPSNRLNRTFYSTLTATFLSSMMVTTTCHVFVYYLYSWRINHSKNSFAPFAAISSEPRRALGIQQVINTYRVNEEMFVKCTLSVCVYVCTHIYWPGPK